MPWHICRDQGTNLQMLVFSFYPVRSGNRKKISFLPWQQALLPLSHLISLILFVCFVVVFNTKSMGTGVAFIKEIKDNWPCSAKVGTQDGNYLGDEVKQSLFLANKNQCFRMGRWISEVWGPEFVIYSTHIKAGLAADVCNHNTRRTQGLVGQPVHWASSRFTETFFQTRWRVIEEGTQHQLLPSTHHTE